MYSLTKNEIISLRSSDGTLEIGLASAAISGFLTVMITVLTVPMSPVMLASFIAAAIATGFTTLFFGIKAIVTRTNADKAMKSMFERDGNLRTFHSRTGA